MVGGWARISPLTAYLHEITHPVEGPIGPGGLTPRVA